MFITVHCEAGEPEYEIVSPEDVFSAEARYPGLYHVLIRPSAGMVHVLSGFFTYAEVCRIKRKVNKAFSKNSERITI